MLRSLSVRSVTGGHRYCTQACATVARLASQRRAGQKYQSTRTGHFNNAARQKQIVTHQGSPAVTARDVLKNKRIRSEKAEQPIQMDSDLRCHHCGAVCKPFLRLNFLQQSRFSR